MSTSGCNFSRCFPFKRGGESNMTFFFFYFFFKNCKQQPLLIKARCEYQLETLGVFCVFLPSNLYSRWYRTGPNSLEVVKKKEKRKKIKRWKALRRDHSTRVLGGASILDRDSRVNLPVIKVCNSLVWCWFCLVPSCSGLFQHDPFFYTGGNCLAGREEMEGFPPPCRRDNLEAQSISVRREPSK